MTARRRNGAALAAAALGLVASAVSGAPALAGELVTAAPLTLYVGPPRGYATAPQVDGARARHSPALPAPDDARVAWRRQIPGGIGGNVVVDDAGRIFAAGLSRVTQLGADGTLQFTEPAPFSAAVAATLLSDGSRALLTRDGHVMGWSETGAPVFDVVLPAPPPSAQSSVLPLPDGGLLIGVGSWLFELDATRTLRVHAALPAAVDHTLLLGERALAVDEQGTVFEWDRSERPHALGAFGGPASAVLADADALVALTAKRTLERLDPSSGGRGELARLDPGTTPLLALVEHERWLVMRSDGTWLVAEPGAKVPGAGSPLSGINQADALADASGRVAWWAANAPLHLETAPGVGREIPEVRCAVPASLVPAGPSQLVAACSSGLIWLLGPASSSDGRVEPLDNVRP